MRFALLCETIEIATLADENGYKPIFDEIGLKRCAHLPLTLA